jgi:hypothetical protein
VAVVAGLDWWRHWRRFLQGTNAPGLTNTDLRSAAAGRPVPFDTTWFSCSTSLRKGANMRKTIADHIALLNKTASEIALSAPITARNCLLRADATRGPARRPRSCAATRRRAVTKGLNYTPVLPVPRAAGDAVVCAEGGPVSSARQRSDGVPDEISDLLDDGSMRVTHYGDGHSTAELPGEARIFTPRCQGNLAKMQGQDGEEILIKTELPPDYHEFLTISGRAGRARHACEHLPGARPGDRRRSGEAGCLA